MVFEEEEQYYCISCGMYEKEEAIAMLPEGCEVMERGIHCIIIKTKISWESLRGVFTKYLVGVWHGYDKEEDE